MNFLVLPRNTMMNQRLASLKIATFTGMVNHWSLAAQLGSSNGHVY